MSNTLSPPQPNEAFALRQTNVSNPSVIHSRPSQQSISASEDYYSLSGSNSSTHSREAFNAAAAQQSQHTITRYQTPPSRYRTPQQSRDLLPLPQQHHAVEEQIDEEFRKTPMRGEGKRRQSAGEASGAAGVSEPLLQQQPQPQPQLREGGIKRKPVPSADMSEGGGRISPTAARSSVYRDIGQQRDAPTPGIDDTPYIHFALDQLTRDEEVRGSRRYPGIAPGIDGDYPYQVPPDVQPQPPAIPEPAHRYTPVPQEERDIVKAVPFVEEPIANPYYAGSRGVHGPPQQQAPKQQGPNIYMPVAMEESRQPPLYFVPGILRPLPLGLYILLVLAYLVLLIVAASYSVANTGLLHYGSFGDGKYFLFRYLPTVLGIIVLMWLFEIQKAVYRIGPFIAMASISSVRSRIVGAGLPLYPVSFVKPYFGHFNAQQPIIGGFLFVAWLQIFTIPLLGSSFNVYQDNGVWSWIALQGVIWVVVVLYIILLVALITLLIWLIGAVTGLKWDPRCLADIVVLLERSNALDGQGDNVPQLGYFQTAHRPNEVFHTYGVADKQARSYAVVDGQIREKRYSDPSLDLERGQPPRLSKEAMLPRRDSDEDLNNHASSVLPWFLKPAVALLWPIIAIVLLLAFLVVSYLPSTTVANGFKPMVPPEVNTAGFSSTNFLYSFIPTLLATLLLLFWTAIDNSHRYLAPFASLTGTSPPTSTSEKISENHPGDIAERTLLTSYAADLPIVVTLSALFNVNIRVAFTSAVTLITMALPILASGVFWAEFYISTQDVRISAHMPGYYALSVFLTIHALAYVAIYPPRSLRHTTPSLRHSDITTFSGLLGLFHQSRLVDEVAFHNPVSKTDLVTRLLSSIPGAPQVLPAPAAAESKISLADSIRGFGRARAAAQQPVPQAGGTPRYAFGRFSGRDGRDYIGIDRVRA